MKRITRQELRSLETELEQLEQQACELARSESPDEISINWIASRTDQIKSLLGYEETKARFTERGLSLVQ